MSGGRAIVASRNEVSSALPSTAVMITSFSSESPSVSTLRPAHRGVLDRLVVLRVSGHRAGRPQLREPLVARTQYADQLCQARVVREAAGGAAQVGHDGGVRFSMRGLAAARAETHLAAAAFNLLKIHRAPTTATT
jgi:hypothetical protein